MAEWVDTDPFKIAKYLGYGFTAPEMVFVQGSMDRLTPGAIEIVQAALFQLDKIDEQIRESAPFAGNSFRSGASGSTQYFRGARMEELKTEGRRQVQGLARMLNMAIYRDVFSSGSGTGQIVRG